MSDENNNDAQTPAVIDAACRMPVLLLFGSALAWLVLILTLVIGIRCRLTDRRPTTRWTAGGLSALVLLGWWTPAPWTLLTGAILAAGWLLLLLPSSLWNRQSADRLASTMGDFDALEDE